MNIAGQPLLSATNLVLRAGTATLLDQVSLQLHAGEVLGVIGPNGAGKSTLLKVLAGVSKADSGALYLQQQTFQSTVAAQRARTLAYLEQRPTVYWPLSVRQVVTLGRLPHGGRLDANGQSAIARALAATDTELLTQRSFHTLSEGEKMRVNLARVLATEPAIILADEPTAALDPWHQLQLLELFNTLAARGLGIVLVLHDLALAARFCTRLLLLDQGRMVASGAAQEVLGKRQLATTYRIDAELDPATLDFVIRGRL